MILEEWLISNYHRILQIDAPKNFGRLHVVGTCGNCRHWDKNDNHTKWCPIYESEETCTEWEGDHTNV